MEFEDGEEVELAEERPELAPATDEPGIAISSDGPSDRWSKIAPLICGALLVTTGIVVFQWTGWTLGVTGESVGSRWLERPGPADGFMAGPGVFFAITAAAVIEGLRGRGYKRWLLLVIGPLAGILAAKTLGIWFSAVLR